MYKLNSMGNKHLFKHLALKTRMYKACTAVIMFLYAMRSHSHMASLNDEMVFHVNLFVSNMKLVKKGSLKLM